MIINSNQSIFTITTRIAMTAIYRNISRVILAFEVKIEAMDDVSEEFHKLSNCDICMGDNIISINNIIYLELNVSRVIYRIISFNNNKYNLQIFSSRVFIYVFIRLKFIINIIIIYCANRSSKRRIFSEIFYCAKF